MAYSKKIATPAQRLKEILALRRMKQTDLSDRTGFSKPVISSYVTGKYQPKPDSLARLSTALGVSEQWLAGYDVPLEVECTDGDLLPSPDQIGETIKTARLKKNLSQEQLGDMIGVGKSCISKWERGAVIDLKRSSIQRLTEILEIPLELLIDITPQEDEQYKSRTQFAENLAFYLQQTRVSQKNIADVIGVSAPTVNEWLKGKKYPRPEKLEKLARYFDVSIADLIGKRKSMLDDSNIKHPLFARNLNYHANKLGITQTQIVQALGISKATVSYWFNGRSCPSLEKMKLLAKILGLSVSDLIDDCEDTESTTDERAVMASNINYFMAIKGLSRKQLCEDLGFNYNTLSDWLQGEKYPRIEKIVAMAQYFGCDKSDLIEKKDRTKAQTPIILDRDVMELLELYQKCNEEQKRAIKQMLLCFMDKK